MTGRLASWARGMRRDALALYFAWGHPRVPWYAKGLALAVAAYALSPIDLVPDFIPVLGYLDDLIIVPLGVLVVARLIPAEVMAELRQRAEVTMAGRAGRVAAAVIIAVWMLVAMLAAWLVLSPVGR
ncbi:MAG: YkvA family protein [Alphaproteobacteria bacterium]